MSVLAIGIELVGEQQPDGRAVCGDVGAAQACDGGRGLSAIPCSALRIPEV